MRLPLTLLSVCCALTFQLSHAQEKRAAMEEEFKKQAAIYNTTGQNVPEGYVIGRSLMGYATLLSPDFRNALGKLSARDRWLDIGAGEGRAMLDYATAKYEAMLQRASRDQGRAAVIAMSIEDRRTPHWHEAAKELSEDRLRYLFGKSLRDYSLAELGQFELITDVIGGFSYTRDIAQFMEQTLRFLAVNGTFYTLLQDVSSEAGDNKPYYHDKPPFVGAPFLTEIVNADGKELKVCSWLKRITCVEVACNFNPNTTPPTETYRIRKTCDDVAVPALEPVHYEAGTPPERRYVVKSPAERVQEWVRTAR
jgi:SAM-dependent methyltransferase